MFQCHPGIETTSSANITMIMAAENNVCMPRLCIDHLSGIPSSPNFGDTLSAFGPGTQKLTQP